MARSSGSTLRMKQQRSGSVLYRGPGSVTGLSSTRLRPYRVANRSLNSYVSAKWNPVSRKSTGTVRSMRLSRCASTTPPPPKLTVRAVFPGNASTAHKRIVSGSACFRARARSRTCAVLSIARTPQVAELEQTVDHADVDVAVLARESQPPGEILAHLVPVEHFDRDAPTTQLRAHRRGERGLAGARQPGEPQREAVRLRQTPVRHQFRLSHFSLQPSLSHPPSPQRGEGDRG